MPQLVTSHLLEKLEQLEYKFTYVDNRIEARLTVKHKCWFIHIYRFEVRTKFTNSLEVTPTFVTIK